MFSLTTSCPSRSKSICATRDTLADSRPIFVRAIRGASPTFDLRCTIHARLAADGLEVDRIPVISAGNAIEELIILGHAHRICSNVEMPGMSKVIFAIEVTSVAMTAATKCGCGWAFIHNPKCEGVRGQNRPVGSNRSEHVTNTTSGSWSSICTASGWICSESELVDGSI